MDVMTHISPPRSPIGADPLLELQIAVFGLHGQNGLYRSHKALAADVAEIKATAAKREDLAAIQATFAKLAFLARTLRWLVLAAFFLAVTLAPDDMAEKIAKALGAVKVLAGVL
jgi:hypothetical protein